MSLQINRRKLGFSAAAIAATYVRSETASAQETPVGTPDPAVTESPAGMALQWVIAVINGDLSLPAASDIAEHFSRDFLAVVPAEQMVLLFTQLHEQSAPATIDGIIGTPTALALDAIATDRSGDQVIISITVDEAEPHLITGLLLQPYSDATPEPIAPLADWAALDTVLAAAGPLYAIYAAEIQEDTSFKVIYESGASPILAIGSSFKLYVLAALAQAVSDGNVDWDDTVEVTAELKSQPSGITQNELSGTSLSVRELATRMISISDNTATDMLITYLGRPACEAQLEPLGNSDPERTMPLLKTRELFTLKLGNHPELAAKYVAGGIAQRRRVLEEIAGNPLPTVDQAAGWTAPILIDSVEWFATVSDLVTAIERLWGMGSGNDRTAIQQVLTTNPGIPLDASIWQNVAFKGGSEPGVLTLAWRLERADGKAFVFACGVNNPMNVLPESDIILAAAGAFGLLANA